MKGPPLPPIALTMGEPGGVGPEIAAKAHAELRGGGPAFLLIGDPSLMEARGARVAVIQRTADAVAAFADALPVLDMGAPITATPGVAAPENAGFVIESIETAVRLALSGEACAVVTNPIRKAALIAHGFAFPGHTEFLEALTRESPMPSKRARGAVMMLVGPELRAVPVTIHHSVREAAAILSERMIADKAMIVDEALRCDFGIAQPRLAISGLNPHAGEEGAMGEEEKDIIAPAIARLRNQGVNASGPWPADTMFHETARSRYDAAICMLHDQALIPAKTLAFHGTVNVTLGLPIIRTSPDHGTALDIAGKGLARADSLIAAIRLAAMMAEARRRVAS